MSPLFKCTFTITASLLLTTKSLAEQDHELDKVQVTANQNEEISAEETGLKVDVVDAEQFHNSSMDINQVLNTQPGIVVRLEGGLGSSSKLAINGLSDKQIRYFINGVPMENFGSSLTIDNYLIDLVDRVEVYKGVVPTHLSADALGGAINIITPPHDHDYFNASYSYGSFNTHRASLNTQRVNDAGMFAHVSGFYNYSDNDYEIDNVNTTDEFGNIEGTRTVKRFHDQYRSRMLALKLGIINQEWTDELSINLTKADNRNNIQHPMNNINDAWGKFHTRNKTNLASLNYKWNVNNFDIHAYYLQGRSDEQFNDSASRTYDWDGSYVEETEHRGEYRERSILDLKDKLSRGKLQLGYQFNPVHKIGLSIAANKIERQGNDRINNENNLYLNPKEMEKYVTALSYDVSPYSIPLKLGTFVKHYKMKANVESLTPITGFRVQTDVDADDTGYGLYGIYDFDENLSAKASYENAYRIPETDELLGFGFTVRPNPSLEPEQSNNYNLGLIAKYDFNDLHSSSEINIFNRQARDFIRFNLDRSVNGIYENVSDVDITGIELSQLFDYQNTLSVNLSVTYQDLINKSKFDKDGRQDFNNGSRIPNEPYLFGNMRTEYKLNTESSGEYSFVWITQYTHEYFLHWENLGNSSDKSVIESTLLHDIEVVSSFDYGTYNVSLSANNIFDEEVYDNYNLQKPGRSFFLKFRLNY